MKKLILVSMLLASATAAHADDSFIPSELELSVQCQKKIVTATIRQCNHDSWAAEGKDRMHPCINSEANVFHDHPETASFELSYTAGDADAYWYTVDITDKASCKFTFKAQN